MNKFINILLVSTFLLSSITIAYAQEEREVRNLSPYHSVKVSGSYKVQLVVGDPGSITLEGSKLSVISTSIKNNVLHIRSKPNLKWTNWRGSTTITVPIEDIKSLSLSGSGKITGDRTLDVDKLKISVSGSGRVNLNVSADSIESSVSGSGGITLSGDTDKVSFSLAGSGYLKASDLKADSAIGNISGSGSIEVYASDSFNGHVSGSGRITCYGNPEKQNQKISGSGRISFAN